MTRMRTTALALAIGVALAAAACVETKSTGVSSPSQVSAVLATGSWSSASMTATTLDVGTCGNLEWKISTMTATTASGTFKATCGGGLTLEGSAEGRLNGLTADLSASGTVGGTGNATCPFSLTGTAVPASLDSIRITYSGTTCLGPVSGSEVLRKH
jgi:hypothetical protein